MILQDLFKILHGKILTRSFSGLNLAIQELREPETKTCKYLDDLAGKFNLDDFAWYDSQYPSWSGEFNFNFIKM